MSPFKRPSRHSLLLALTLVVGCGTSEAPAPDGAAAAVTPAASFAAKPPPPDIGFDPAADPAADLAAAVEQARAGGGRILLEVGGNWCPWCQLLERFLHQDEELRRRLETDYVVVKVNVSKQNKNREFLSRYPEVPGLPHFFVLDADGELLHSQGTGEFEKGEGYDREKILAFLRGFAPARDEG